MTDVTLSLFNSRAFRRFRGCSSHRGFVPGFVSVSTNEAYFSGVGDFCLEGRASLDVEVVQVIAW
jgi:hypothetical protein